MANGFNVAEQGHPVNMLPAVSISGGKTTIPVSMANAEHISIIIAFGASAALPTSIIVKQTTTEAGGTNAAMGFRYYYTATGGAGNDVLLGPFYAAATGITSTLPVGAPLPAGGVANLMYVIEIDSAELEAIASVVGPITEYPYVEVVIADSGNVTISSVIGILSGLRFAYKGSASATV